MSRALENVSPTIAAVSVESSSPRTLASKLCSTALVVAGVDPVGGIITFCVPGIFRTASSSNRIQGSSTGKSNFDDSERSPMGAAVFPSFEALIAGNASWHQPVASLPYSNTSRRAHNSTTWSGAKRPFDSTLEELRIFKRPFSSTNRIKPETAELSSKFQTSHWNSRFNDFTRTIAISRQSTSMARELISAVDLVPSSSVFSDFSVFVESRSKTNRESPKVESTACHNGTEAPAPPRFIAFDNNPPAVLRAPFWQERRIFWIPSLPEESVFGESTEISLMTDSVDKSTQDSRSVRRISSFDVCGRKILTSPSSSSVSVK
mmetsp:Transcript_19085/g.39485  ORF Transcript_19085/g.39485 Transcript_19085/m.39485 type:complete len:320 (-) Transcript_19085:1506-2465(-)